MIEKSPFYYKDAQWTSWSTMGRRPVPGGLIEKAQCRNPRWMMVAKGSTALFTSSAAFSTRRHPHIHTFSLSLSKYTYTHMLSIVRSAAVAGRRSTVLPRVAATSAIVNNQQSRSYVSKKKKKAAAREDPDALDMQEAVRVLKAFEVGEPSHQIEAHIQCKIEKSTPIIRGSLVLPRSIKQEATILVFATGKHADEARAAGAHYVGGQELIEQVQNGDLKFDKCISTPAMFPAVTKIARVLGPKGLMPTVKKGKQE